MQVIDYSGSVLMLLIDGITNTRITLDANDQRFCIKEYAQAAASGAGEWLKKACLILILSYHSPQCFLSLFWTRAQFAQLKSVEVCY